MYVSAFADLLPGRVRVHADRVRKGDLMEHDRAMTTF